MFSWVELSDLLNWRSAPVVALMAVFQIWMIIDAARRREWVWVFLLVFFSTFAAIWYYLTEYRGQPRAMRGFELPGAHDRRRIKELRAQIHHLDKPHHHLQLGDIYFQQGKLKAAESCYRAALERDPQDRDTRSHLGQCLLRQQRTAEARPLLEGVVAEDERHEYGHTLMALAEALTAMNETEDAIAVWQRVTDQHSYPRAKVQLAELLAKNGQTDEARAQLEEVLADDPHAPVFQRRRDRVWVRRARSIVRKLG